MVIVEKYAGEGVNVVCDWSVGSETFCIVNLSVYMCVCVCV